MKFFGEFGFEQPTNLAFVQTLLLQGFKKFAHLALRVAELFSLRTAAAAGGDECSEAVADFEDAFLLQIAIDLDDGVGVDDECFGEATDSGELIAGDESAGLDGVTNLFFELNVDGDAGGRIGFAKHCTTVIAQCIIKDKGRLFFGIRLNQAGCKISYL